MTVRRLSTASAVLVFIVAALAGQAAGLAGPSSAPHSDAVRATNQQLPTVVFIDMVDIAFAPKEITIPAYTDVTINLVNNGAAVHTFNIDELNVHSGDYDAGQSGSLTINAAPGDYQFYCGIPGHEQAGMVGVIHVVESFTAGTPGARGSGTPIVGSSSPAPTVTPSSSDVQDFPQAWECGVDAVGFADLISLADDVSSEADRDADPARISLDQLPAGDPVTDDDMQGILATTREIVACVNADDPFRVAALLTERFLTRLALDLLSGQGGITEVLDQLPALSEQVDPDQELAMIPITSAWYPFPPDKTIYAVLSSAVEGLEEQRDFLVVFTYSDHRWLIDAMVLIE
ncbi:MAG: hypothetical protein QOF73_3625 [Thermomicrobiales bacterium]|jgi:plastocyanin|nr:hypothetical protein [Thermomicrobiales bacterium]